MSRDNAPRLVMVILWLIAALAFCYSTTQAAPQDTPPCKLTFDRALALVHGSDHIADVGNMVGEWGIRQTAARENFHGLPRVVTITLFNGDAFAGLLDVRGAGAVLRIRVRPGGKALDTCYSGAIDAAIVQGWIAR